MTDARRIELERAEAARAALEMAAVKLDVYATGEIYRKAFRRAAFLVRSLKDSFDSEVYQKDTDNHARDVQS